MNLKNCMQLFKNYFDNFTNCSEKIKNYMAK